MHDCTRTPMPSMAAEAAQTLGDIKSVPSCNSPMPPSSIAPDPEPSSEVGRAADSTNEPQPGGSPNAPSNSMGDSLARRDCSDDNGSSFERDKGYTLGATLGCTGDRDDESMMSDTSESVFDPGDGSPSSAASGLTDDRDEEPMLVTARTFILDRADGSDYADDSDAISTSSLGSLYFEYVEENGRAYHAGPQSESYWYCWPNDEQQNETLEEFHSAFRLLLNDKLYLAPIGKYIQNVLDVGTGTGVWAIEFADEHPSAFVTGTDISPIQPTWVPCNLEFLIDDCNQPWSRRERFEFIHARGMAGSISDWPKFAKEAFDASRPGGYFECQEISMRFKSDDGTLEDCDVMKQWGGFWKEVGVKLKRPFTTAEDGTLRESMELAGFTDIQERDYKMPVGGWARDPRLKEVGRRTLAALDNDLEGFVLRPAIEVLGWSRGEAFLFATQLRREMRSKWVHAYIPYKVVVGRKPN